jgi:hypothetical protein
VEVGSSVVMVEVDQGGEREGGGGGLTVDTVRILRLVLWPVQCQRRQLYSSSNVHNSSSSRELEGMVVSSSSSWQTVCPAHCPSLRVGRPRELEEPLDLQEAQIRQLPGTHMEWLTAVPR